MPSTGTRDGDSVQHCIPPIETKSGDRGGSEIEGVSEDRRGTLMEQKDTESTEKSSVEPVRDTSELTESEYNCIDEDVDVAIGEDVDVAMMNAEDGFIQMEHDQNMMHHSYEYLQDCRRILMEKVAHYRTLVEKKTTEIKKKEYEHRQQIERIRKFYQAMAYAPTRLAKIFKKSYCASSSAAEVLRAAGLSYKKHMLEYKH